MRGDRRRNDSLLDEDEIITAAPATGNSPAEGRDRRANDATTEGMNTAAKPAKAHTQPTFWHRVKAMASGGLGGKA